MAQKQVGRRKDFTQTALDVVRKATGQVNAPAPAKKPAGGRKAAPNKAKPARPEDQ